MRRKRGVLPCVLGGICSVGLLGACAGSSSNDEAEPTVVTSTAAEEPELADSADANGNAPSSETTVVDAESEPEGSVPTLSGDSAAPQPIAPPVAPNDGWSETDAEATEVDPVPVRETFAFDDQWRLAIADVDLDAAAKVLAYDEINPAPAAGTNYVAVTVNGTYVGVDVAQPAFDFVMINDGREYRPSVPGCGLLPSSIYDVGDLESGDDFSALLCIPVAAVDANDDLTLLFTPAGGETRFFELSGDA